ncbi:MAG: FAD-dependent monooxygenase [Granulosicoccaceae bacterium]
MTKILTLDALVVGAGPAGLIAAHELAQSGCKVALAEAMPAPARKLLMAGKSGLNITKDESFERFITHYGEAADFLHPMLEAFGPVACQQWCEDLGQPVFCGSSGRVFPQSMKASPLLRAWLAKLGELDVDLHRRWEWQGFDGPYSLFETPEGPVKVNARCTILALGGASWKRLGSNGKWSNTLAGEGIQLTPFAAANASLRISWSQHMHKHLGQAVKNIELQAGAIRSRAELIISKDGLEGSGAYSVCKAVRQGQPLRIDLLPDVSLATVRAKLSRPQGKTTLSNYLRKSLTLSPTKLALLQEFGRPLHNDEQLASKLKSLQIQPVQVGPIERAISTAGGVSLEAVDSSLMLIARPGVYCVGEMLDWEAPTGGYLLTACLATGRWAGRAAARRLLQEKNNKK